MPKPPKTTSLVDILFKKGQQAAGRGRKVDRPTALALTGAGMEDIVRNDAEKLMFDTAVESPAKAFGGALEYQFKSRGMAAGLENLMISASKGFVWEDKSGRLGGAGTRYSIDAGSGELIGPGGVRTGTNIKDVDPMSVYNAPDATKATFWGAVQKQVVNYGKTLPIPGIGGETGVFNIYEKLNVGKNDPFGVFRDEALLGKRGMRFRKNKFVDDAANEYQRRTGVTAGQTFRTTMEKNFDNVIDPSLKFMYEKGQYGKVAMSLLGDNAGEAFKFRDSAGNVLTIAQMKNGTAEQQAIAGTVEGMIKGKVGGGNIPLTGPGVLSITRDPLLAIGYMNNFNNFKAMFNDDPSKNIANVFNQFVLTNAGWVKLSSNQWLNYMAATKGGFWKDTLNFVTNKRNNHWTMANPLTKGFERLGKEIGEAVARRVGQLLAKMGLQAGAQAVGSLAPIIGNIIAFLATELIFKLFDPIMRVVKEMFRLLMYIIFVLVGIFVCGFISIINGSFPDFSLPSIGIERPIDAEGAPLIDRVRIPPSDGACPMADMSRCTQGYEDASTYHQDHLALDFGGQSVGTPVYTPLSGQVVKIVDYPCDGFGNYEVIVRGADGMEVVLEHLNKNVGLGDTLSAGDAVGTVGSGVNLGCWTGPHLHIHFQRNGIPLPADEVLESLGCTDFNHSCVE